MCESHSRDDYATVLGWPLHPARIFSSSLGNSLEVRSPIHRPAANFTPSPAQNHTRNTSNSAGAAWKLPRPAVWFRRGPQCPPLEAGSAEALAEATAIHHRACTLIRRSHHEPEHLSSTVRMAADAGRRHLSRDATYRVQHRARCRRGHRIRRFTPSGRSRGTPALRARQRLSCAATPCRVIQLNIPLWRPTHDSWNAPAHYLCLTSARQRAGVAIQPQLGVWPERSAGCDSGDCYPSLGARQDLACPLIACKCVSIYQYF